jgi:hypothetical protein
MDMLLTLMFLFAAGLASRSLYLYLRNATDCARAALPTLAMPNPQCAVGASLQLKYNPPAILAEP